MKCKCKKIAGNQNQSYRSVMKTLSPVLPLLFFFTRSGVFLFYLGFWGFHRKSGFFWLWTNFRKCMSYYCIFHSRIQ